MKLLGKYSLVKLSIAAVLATCGAMWVVSRVSLANDHYGPSPEGYAIIQSAKDSAPTVSGGAVEVLDLYFSACPHCKSFDPKLQAWIEMEGSRIHVRRIPVANGDVLTRHAALFYSLDRMGQADRLRTAIYDALADDSHALDTDQKIADWVTKRGVDASEFGRLYRSPDVAAVIQAGRDELAHTNVNTVPAIVIGGKWVVSPTTAGDEAKALDVMSGRIDAALGSAAKNPT
ncbi:DsbA family protein [Burkholderia sp. Ac-20365]|uniref:DsbA family protein n=1 Tax=Burkholderia sp. Ac-20365 TaxID=2703897 RepID=UPI00197C92AB|nr:DsbA family protein [Burkholderia sp. Ac-20365]MBN3760935.1 thioredoxin domain-containing protein [Burkholderia sp. Ac-20365]